MGRPLAEWMARTSSEKALARRQVRRGEAVITATVLENYIGKRGLVNYEAWYVTPCCSRAEQPNA